MRLQDISKELNINVSTVLRFLNSLQAAGYVDQEKDSRQYFLTYKICYLANMVSSRTRPWPMWTSSPTPAIAW